MHARDYPRWITAGTLSAALAFTGFLALAENQAAHADHEHHTDGHDMMPAPPAHPLFDKFKALEGRWEGTFTPPGAEPQPAAFEYRLTAGGGALLETIFPGTPMEMISVYFVDGDTLKMTHYCIAQNQPTLAARPGPEDNVVELRFQSATNMPDPNAMHMRHTTFTFLGPSHIRIQGEGWVNNAPDPGHCPVIELRRVAE